MHAVCSPLTPVLRDYATLSPLLASLGRSQFLAIGMRISSPSEEEVEDEDGASRAAPHPRMSSWHFHECRSRTGSTRETASEARDDVPTASTAGPYPEAALALPTFLSPARISSLVTHIPRASRVRLYEYC